MDETYKTIYRIRVEHEYFTGLAMPQMLALALTDRGMRQARRNGMLFRQVASGEWELVHDGCHTIEDSPLELGMSVADPQSWHYTVWPKMMPPIEAIKDETDKEKKFNIRKAHTLAIPVPRLEEDKNKNPKTDTTAKVEIDVAASIRDVVEEITVGDRKIPRRRMRGFGEPFCIVELGIDGGLLKYVRVPECVLRFHAPAFKWEYLFLSKLEVDESRGKVALKDTKTSIAFEVCKKNEDNRPNMDAHAPQWHFVSTAPVPLRAAYGCRLRLVLEKEEEKKNSNGKAEMEEEKKDNTLQVLIAQVPPPEPGRFLDTTGETLRQICYY